MKYLEQRFTVFVITSLKILFFLILIGSIGVSIGVFLKLPKSEFIKLLLINLLFMIVSLGIAYLVYKYLRRNKNYSKIIVIILSISFILRIIWILAVDTKPVSDFGLIYDSAKQFANGEYWVFKGTSYMARFPHLTMLTIYLGLFQKIFINPLLIIKLANIVLSTISIYLIYLIGTELYNDRVKGVWIALLASFFPAFIIYNSVVCSENLAIPFFLGSTYIFILIIKGKKNIAWFLYSGLLLSIGNLFRMVAFVFVIAYIIYLVVYWDKKKFAKSCSLILLSFFIPLYIANTVLLGFGITEYSLWKGREPFITSVLKGTNINAIGMWNEEDSKIPAMYNYDYGAVETATKGIIKDRLTTTPLYKLIAFYIVKFIAQWSFGDFSAVNWATGETGVLGTVAALSTFVFLFSQLLFVMVVLCTYKGLFIYKKYTENKIINLFYIIFCGYVLLYLITEQQQRYGYIISWVFVLLGFTNTVNRNQARVIISEVKPVP
ncbi:MAG: glycosyltransferase family 39 protein [Ruminiclostridium sp.]|nr:glycosyltransferase family 39 protein [Ruminiclostridium sp.]